MPRNSRKKNAVEAEVIELFPEKNKPAENTEPNFVILKDTAPTAANKPRTAAKENVADNLSLTASLANLRERIKNNQPVGLKEKQNVLLEIIRQAATENPSIGSKFLQEGIAISDKKTKNIFEAGEKSLLTKLLNSGLTEQLEVLLVSGEEPSVIRKEIKQQLIPQILTVMEKPSPSTDKPTTPKITSPRIHEKTPPMGTSIKKSGVWEQIRGWIK